MCDKTDTKDRGGTVCDKTRTQTKEIRSRVECWAESSDCNDSETLTLSLMCSTLTAVSKGNLDILQNLDILHILNSGLSHKIL